MRYTVQNSRGTQRSVIEAETPKDAALMWAHEWLDEDEDDRCHVFVDGVRVAAFDLTMEREATEVST